MTCGPARPATSAPAPGRESGERASSASAGARAPFRRNVVLSGALRIYARNTALRTTLWWAAAPVGGPGRRCRHLAEVPDHTTIWRFGLEAIHRCGDSAGTPPTGRPPTAPGHASAARRRVRRGSRSPATGVPAQRYSLRARIPARLRWPRICQLVATPPCAGALGHGAMLERHPCGLRCSARQRRRSGGNGGWLAGRERALNARDHGVSVCRPDDGETLGHGTGRGRVRTCCGHQNQRPSSAAIDGVMNDRITSVSKINPMPIVVPT